MRNWDMICVDLDGTLLTDEKEVLPEVRDCLKRYYEQGTKIALVSGRMPKGVENIENILGFPCVKICNAGSFICIEGKDLSTAYLSNEALRRIHREIAAPEDVKMWIFRDRDWMITGYDVYIRREIEIIGYDPEVVDPLELADKWEAKGYVDGPSKLLLAAQPEMVDAFAQKIADMRIPGVETAKSADIFLEIFPAGVSKGNAIRRVADELGIDLARVVAFGDHELDLPMLQAAGVSVAMGNAIGSLKEKADYVTKSNNEGGVAYALEHLLR